MTKSIHVVTSIKCGHSKDFLDNFNARTFSKISSIETFDFSTLYTTIPNETLKTRLKEVIHNAFTLNLAGNVVRL